MRVWADGDCHAASASMQRFRVCLENIKTVAKLYSVQLPVVLMLWPITHRNAALTVLSMIRGGGEGFCGDFILPQHSIPAMSSYHTTYFRFLSSFLPVLRFYSILLSALFLFPLAHPFPHLSNLLPFLFVVFFNEVTQSVICCTVRAVQWRECQSYP